MPIPYFPLAAWHTPSNVHPEMDPRQRLHEFIEEFEQRLASLTWGQPFPTILLAETDPLRYIAGFLVAVHHHCPVILANPHWGDWEWQQVYQQVHPHLCFADSLFNLPPFPSTSQLPSSLILIPTGGTSGQMRFVQHTWKTLMASIQGFQKHFQIDIIHSCCLLPLYHVSGLMQFLRSYVSGGQLIIMPFKSLTAARMAKLQADVQKLQAQVAALDAATKYSLWRNDLAELRDAYTSFRQRKQARYAVKTAVKAAKAGKRSTKSSFFSDN